MPITVAASDIRNTPLLACCRSIGVRCAPPPPTAAAAPPAFVFPPLAPTADRVEHEPNPVPAVIKRVQGERDPVVLKQVLVVLLHHVRDAPFRLRFEHP